MLKNLILACCLFACLEAAWQNKLGRRHIKKCSGGSFIRRIKSIHDNDANDRRWEVICGKINNYPLSASQFCHWTPMVNDVDEMVAFNCPGNGILTGMQSDHEGEDRRFHFRCCKVPWRKPSGCQMSDYASAWDEDMDYSVPHSKVITGAFSYHNEDFGDRRWKFMECDI